MNNHNKHAIMENLPQSLVSCSSG